MVNRANSDVGPVLILAGIIIDIALVLSFLKYRGMNEERDIVFTYQPRGIDNFKQIGCL